jgi:hypothetical protein
MIGDCDGARASFQRSDAAKRANMIGVDQKKLKNMVDQCVRRPPPAVADFSDTPEEPWGTSFF